MYDNENMEPNANAEGTTDAEVGHECDTAVHFGEKSNSDRVKKIVIGVAAGFGLMYVADKIKPHYRKWKRNRCAAYVERYDREAENESACEVSSEVEVAN